MKLPGLLLYEFAHLLWASRKLHTSSLSEYMAIALAASQRLGQYLLKDRSLSVGGRDLTFYEPISLNQFVRSSSSPLIDSGSRFHCCRLPIPLLRLTCGNYFVMQFLPFRSFIVGLGRRERLVSVRIQLDECFLSIYTKMALLSTL